MAVCRLSLFMKHILRHPFFIRLLHWEYWSSRIVYAPLYPVWVWFSLRARSFFFLTAANPRIRNGGFIMESKKDIYDQLPAGVSPVTCYFESGTPPEAVWNGMEDCGLQFPVIAKPDHGERGLGVKKINDVAELEDYARRMPVAWLLQEYIDYPHEAGIFYYRFPGEAKGRISGIVHKEPVMVTGDGRHTLAELVHREPRYILQWQHIRRTHAARLNDVPPPGEELVLVQYGNHSRGSKFTDISARTTPQLTTVIDHICRQMPEFYYGRLDIRYRDWASLERGEYLSVIEVNGSGSEPTHMYDPAHSIFFAWKEIVRHWRILLRISKANHRRGVPYISLKQGREEINAFRRIDALLSAQSW
jgi:hypothetical protein